MAGQAGVSGRLGPVPRGDAGAVGREAKAVERAYERAFPDDAAMAQMRAEVGTKRVEQVRRASFVAEQHEVEPGELGGLNLTGEQVGAAREREPTGGEGQIYGRRGGNGAHSFVSR